MRTIDNPLILSSSLGTFLELFSHQALKPVTRQLLISNQANIFFEKLKKEGTFIFTLSGFQSFPYRSCNLTIIPILTVKKKNTGLLAAGPIVLSKLIISNVYISASVVSLTNKCIFPYQELCLSFCSLSHSVHKDITFSVLKDLGLYSY